MQNRKGSNGDVLQGSLRTSGRGFGYFRSAEVDGFIEISPEDLNMAFDLDTVEVRITGHTHEGELKGKVTKVIKRNKNVWVGIVKTRFDRRTKKRQPFFYADDFRFYPKTEIINMDNFKGLKDDKKVSVKLISWKNYHSPAKVKITSILGKIGENETEMRAAVLDRGLAFSFPKEVEEASKKIKENSLELIAEARKHRKDLTKLKVFTIDPADAKDFDDAISVEKLENGNYSIGVHIADPSFYVTPGSIIDKEARERATSIYLVDRTIPMLPEVLSNDLCSLNPNEEKLAFSCIFEMDKNAKVINEWFGDTIILSQRRFNYLEAQDVLDNDKEDSYWEDLKILSDMAVHMEKERYSKGSIKFSSMEVKFKMDDKKFPTDIYIKPHVHTMEIIEEFALLTNKRISMFASLDKDGAKTDNPFIYRIHEKPKIEKIATVIEFLSKFGYNPDTDGDGNLSSHEINKILKDHEGKPEEGLISLSILRSMQKAIYGTKALGHYGLGFKYYSHFTSPIRRYPDMIAHRYLRKYLRGEKVDKKFATEIEKKAIHSSEMEQKAVDAERQSIKFKYTQYYSRRIDEEFYGMVVNITKNGFFVEEKKTKASGFVSVRDIPGNWAFDEKNMTLSNGGNKYRIGQAIKTKVKEVDLEKMRIDLALT